MMLPALSVKQPWASMIAAGDKSIETRTWWTGYRGPLVICSSALPKGGGLTRRALCVVFLKHCRPMRVEDERAACCPIYDQAMAWIFAEQRISLKAMADVRGHPGIFGLILPEMEFFTPQDKELAYKWLDWAKAKGMLEKINELEPQRNADERGSRNKENTRCNQGQ